MATPYEAAKMSAQAMRSGMSEKAMGMIRGAGGKAAMGGAGAVGGIGKFMGSAGGFGPIIALILAEILGGSLLRSQSERTVMGAQTESLGRMGEMMTPQAAMYEEIGPAVDTQLQMTMANLAQLLGPQNQLASGEEYIGGR